MTEAQTADRIFVTSPDDPRAKPLVEDLIREYDSRYGTLFSSEGARAELYRYPAAAFTEGQRGAFLLMERAGRVIAGGAFMFYDAGTAELKRVWADPAFRRQGLAKRVVEALERAAEAQGYTRVYLTTGFRQPEARELYLSLGYRPLFDPTIPGELYATLPFEKHIGALRGVTPNSPLRAPAATPEAAAAAASARKAQTASRKSEVAA
ncbi:GNAT family N-acetyltransferase [Falsigemmobacter faecalis]|uniref:GNAT family N-acetyltransferase n=1 Tax=Falsigemmobacter faecalis TaxID=2488730 RepID=A0A3P3D6V5_9RHOB|nr:GNAT family N-acetyltransferase [Falsigemmobacter faecalis]RRH70087.1 GNAT family N-acetyltransferase [Falsigemmobacter faecalis]